VESGQQSGELPSRRGDQDGLDSGHVTQPTVDIHGADQQPLDPGCPGT
jgi:hypothetical protein